MLKRWIAASAASLFVAAGLVGASSPVAAAPAPIGSVIVKADPAPPALLPDGTKAKNAVRPAGMRDNVAASAAGKKHLPPAPMGQAKRSGYTYNYAGGQQTFSVAPHPDGMSAQLKVGDPYLQKPPDSHSLGELAVQGGNTATSSDQIVEIGWQKGEASCANVCLFVYHWVNGVQTCYNGCGFVNYAGTPVTPGSSISTWVGTSKTMGWTYSGGAWWASANGSWVGYFPASVWTGASPTATFTNANLIQGFGELVTDTTLSTKCSDMGNGNFGSATIGAPATTIGSYTLTNGPAPVWSLLVTDATKWSVVSVNGSVRTFSYGGPGTGGNIGSC